MAMLASQDRYARDVPLLELTQALNETTACLGVYRTYIRNLELSPEDQAVIEQALAEAQALKPQLHPRASLSSETFFYYGIIRIFCSTARGEACVRNPLATIHRPIMAKSFETRFCMFTTRSFLSTRSAEIPGPPRHHRNYSMSWYKSDHRDGRNL